MSRAQIEREWQQYDKIFKEFVALDPEIETTRGRPIYRPNPDMNLDTSWFAYFDVMSGTLSISANFKAAEFVNAQNDSKLFHALAFVATFALWNGFYVAFREINEAEPNLWPRYGDFKNRENVELCGFTVSLNLFYNDCHRFPDWRSDAEIAEDKAAGRD